jgi:hypothetical protein
VCAAAAAASFVGESSGRGVYATHTMMMMMMMLMLCCLWLLLTSPSLSMCAALSRQT